MFTVEQRDALREPMLRFAEDDARVVAGAAVGSLGWGNLPGKIACLWRRLVPW